MEIRVSRMPKRRAGASQGVQTSLTCFRRKISTETLIETKRKTLRSGFEKKRKKEPFGAGPTVQLAKWASQTTRLEIWINQQVLKLIFIVNSNRKLRLRRNEKRFDWDSKKNAKKEPFGAGPTGQLAKWVSKTTVRRVGSTSKSSNLFLS